MLYHAGPKVKKQPNQTPTGSQKPRKLRVVEATPHTLRLDWIAPKGFYEGYVARLIGDGSSVISTEVGTSHYLFSQFYFCEVF